jgi:hypothetical protein
MSKLTDYQLASMIRRLEASAEMRTGKARQKTLEKIAEYRREIMERFGLRLAPKPAEVLHADR